MDSSRNTSTSTARQSIIIGAVVGGVGLIIVLAIGAFFLNRRRRAIRLRKTEEFKMKRGLSMTGDVKVRIIITIGL